ncbi:hypothetical protein [Arthrobacter sp. B1805]|uniref:hypothetical protein n=1 Tax=Arthrobacter sp. B1805 TaxID=2058892 RepID=UPI000CE2BA3F|nr:hypothetical protein [Arthrobacter sp. B1805]
MGPVDHIANPELPAALSPDLSANLQVHLPELQAPTLEDFLEDQLESGQPNGFSGVGPVDVADASDEARRFFQD